MSWVYLCVAGIFEIAWAVGLKFSQGFTKPWPSAFTIVTLAASLWLLALAARELPIGTAYAVWVGIGATGAAVVGIFLFDEPVSVSRIIFIAMLVTAIVGLKLTAKT